MCFLSSLFTSLSKRHSKRHFTPEFTHLFILLSFTENFTSCLIDLVSEVLCYFSSLRAALLWWWPVTGLFWDAVGNHVEWPTTGRCPNYNDWFPVSVPLEGPTYFLLILWYWTSWVTSPLIPSPELAKSGRAGCQTKECKDEQQKIPKGELRVGSWVDSENRQFWSWRHW